MKFKHNKKRNTAFLYEVLIKEMAKSVIEKDENKKNEIASTAREFFSANKVLGKELRIYRDLNETNSVDLYTAERLLVETKIAFDSVDRKDVFNEQTRLINKINKLVGKDAFNNFVPNYKNLATIYQIFQNGNSAKEKILLERRLLTTMTVQQKEIKEKNMPQVNNLTLKSFIKNYNDKYGESFLEEQKTLLNKYITSFNDNSLELKSYLNEELTRLKKEAAKLPESEDVKGDEMVEERAKDLGKLLESFSNKKIDDKMIIKVLKIQSLLSEVD
tara:strand:- start:552 stop:1373 length:822 start_codon:yes stop_codon:yes gene_type:complete